MPKSPVRDDRRLCMLGWCDLGITTIVRNSVAPDGAEAGRESLVPPLKRWAIVECPWRDKEGPAVVFCD